MREKVPKIGGHPKRLPFQKEITKERNVTDSAPEVPPTFRRCCSKPKTKLKVGGTSGAECRNMGGYPQIRN